MKPQAHFFTAAKPGGASHNSFIAYIKIVYCNRVIACDINDISVFKRNKKVCFGRYPVLVI